MKRQRFTIDHPIKGRFVALAYSAESAEAYFGGKATPGDYRCMGPGWKLSYTNLKKAKAELSISRPVHVKQTSRQGGRRGAYAFRAGEHCITVKSYLTPEQASRTLWHELAHAMQAERSGSEAAWAANSDRKGPYSKRPIEIEARSYEHNASRIPIAVKK